MTDERSDEERSTATADEEESEQASGTDEEEPEQASGGDEDQSEEQQKASEVTEAREEAKKKMEELEEMDADELPKDLSEWPSDEAKYETFGGPEGQDHSYHEGPEEKLGPSSLRHHEGGEVSIEGEKVDDPDEYKGDPIPGGPTDPEAANIAGEKNVEEREGESEDESKGEAERDSDREGEGEKE